MKEYKCYIDSPLGLHARPAALIAKLCVNLKSNVTIINNDKEVSGNDVLGILSLNAKKDDQIIIKVEGKDEEEDLEKIKELLNENLKIYDEHIKTFRIAFFGTKDYDKTFFSELIKDKGPGAYNIEIDF